MLSGMSLARSVPAPFRFRCSGRLALAPSLSLSLILSFAATGNPRLPVFRIHAQSNVVTPRIHGSMDPPSLPAAEPSASDSLSTTRLPAAATRTRSYLVIEQANPCAECRRGRNCSHRRRFLRSMDRRAGASLENDRVSLTIPGGARRRKKKEETKMPRAAFGQLRRAFLLRHFLADNCRRGERDALAGGPRDAGFLGSADGKKRSRPEVEVEVEIEAMRA